MEQNIEKAENTAINAAKAYIKLLDFAASVISALAQSVELNTDLKIKEQPLRYSGQSANYIKRYTKSKSLGELQIRRYIYTLFEAIKKKGSDFIPFLLISLVNNESRPPNIVFGLLKKIEGEEKTIKDFCEFYLLWINEQFNEIKENHGNTIREHELSGSAEYRKLKAFVVFGEERLLDISQHNLKEKAEKITNWFKEEMRKL